MRKGLLSLTFLALLLIPIASILPSSQTYPNTWVIAFYPGSYPSGASPSNYTTFTVNFTVPNYLQTSNGYLLFVLTASVEANEYSNGIYLGTTYLFLQITLDFVNSANTYEITAQVWTYTGTLISYTETPITLYPNGEAFMTLLYNYNNGNVATGAL